MNVSPLVGEKYEKIQEKEENARHISGEVG